MLVMGCFFLYPIFKTVREAFQKPGGGYTMEYVGQIFSNPIYREGFLTFHSAAAGITYQAETSVDLDEWTTVGVTLSPVGSDQRRTASVARGGPGQFLRLKVTK